MGEIYEFGEAPVKLYLEGANFQDSFRLLLAIDNSYKAYGGDQLLLTKETELVTKEATESEYDINKNTEFSNTKKIIAETIFTRYTSRYEVEETIDKFFLPEKTQEIKKTINKTFPEKNFQDDYPYTATLSLLFNEYNKPEYIKNINETIQLSD